MSTVEKNKEIVGQWFADFLGEKCDPGVVDRLAAPDTLLQYSLHAPEPKGLSNIRIPGHS